MEKRFLKLVSWVAVVYVVTVLVSTLVLFSNNSEAMVIMFGRYLWPSIIVAAAVWVYTGIPLILTDRDYENSLSKR